MCKPQTFWLSRHVLPQTGWVSFSSIKGKLCQFDVHFTVSTCKPVLETNHKIIGWGREFSVGSFFFSLWYDLGWSMSRSWEQVQAYQSQKEGRSEWVEVVGLFSTAELGMDSTRATWTDTSITPGSCLNLTSSSWSKSPSAWSNHTRGKIFKQFVWHDTRQRINSAS